jgi:hypothetical protein
MSHTSHLLPRLMLPLRGRIPKIQNTKRSAVDGEKGPHAEDVAVKVGGADWVADTETDVVELPADGGGRLRCVCAEYWGRHCQRGGGREPLMVGTLNVGPDSAASQLGRCPHASRWSFSILCDL